MALRTNLLPNGVQQKVRPLNDAKAIANGANAISEGFLFFVAASLILGETYRSSRKKAEQRDRTEESLDQLKDQLERLATVLGIDLEQLERLTEQDRDGADLEAEPSGSRRAANKNGYATEEADPSLVEARLKVYRERQEEDLRSKQLQAAVSVLLNLALKNRWVVGPEALELESILGASTSKGCQPGTSQPSQPTDASTYSSAQSTNAAFDDSSSTLQPSVIQQVALQRAKALAREVRGESDDSLQPVDASLADLLAQPRPPAST